MDRYREMWDICGTRGDMKGREALFFRVIVSEKKWRQKYEKSKNKLKTWKDKQHVQAEIVENTKSQLQQMEQLARLAQKMHIDERHMFEEELSAKTEENEKLKQHLSKIIKKFKGSRTARRGTKGSRINLNGPRYDPVTAHSHIRKPMGGGAIDAQALLHRHNSHRQQLLPIDDTDDIPTFLRPGPSSAQSTPRNVQNFQAMSGNTSPSYSAPASRATTPRSPRGFAGRGRGQTMRRQGSVRRPRASRPVASTGGNRSPGGSRPESL